MSAPDRIPKLVQPPGRLRRVVALNTDFLAIEPKCIAVYNAGVALAGAALVDGVGG